MHSPESVPQYKISFITLAPRPYFGQSHVYIIVALSLHGFIPEILANDEEEDTKFVPLHRLISFHHRRHQWRWVSLC